MQGPQRIRARFVTSCKSRSSVPLTQGTNLSRSCGTEPSSAWLCWMGTKPYPVPAALGEVVKFSRSMDTHRSFPRNAGWTGWETHPLVLGQGRRRQRGPAGLRELQGSCWRMQSVCWSSHRPQGFAPRVIPAFILGDFVWQEIPVVALGSFTVVKPNTHP